MTRAKSKTIQEMNNELHDGLHASSYYHSKAFFHDRTFPNEKPGISVRNGYTRSDYDYYRDAESLENDPRQVAMDAYESVGIVHNVIDLMADFTCKGIRITHTDAATEKFFKNWWKQVNGDYVSERFSNYLYRIGTVPVRRHYGKIPIAKEKRWRSASGQRHTEQIVEQVVDKRRVPIRYGFINPITLHVPNAELALFTGKFIYCVQISRALFDSIKDYGKKPDESIPTYVDTIPPEIKSLIESGTRYIPLNDDILSVYSYKRDDWDVFAKPMIHSITDDLIRLEKIKLADISALDGVISNVRLWNVGQITDNPATTFIPNPAMLQKLRDILANAGGGGTLDLVWGPELKFTESNTNQYQFLGMDKYMPTLHQIYEGLGIPFAIGSSNGQTNSHVAMQTFVERLEYGRRILVDFWTNEIKLVQKAMGFKDPAIVTFENINLGDDNNYKKLLIDLLDRDVISVDTLLDNFKIFSEVERAKIKREYRMRKSDKMAPKASNFHNPQVDDDFRKILLQNGGVAPSELGIELDERKDGEKSMVEIQQDHQLKIEKQKIKSAPDASSPKSGPVKKYQPKKPGGRPDGATDRTKRKKKKILTRTQSSQFASMFIWANEAQKKISEIVAPLYLEHVNKKNVRSLSNDEVNALEAVKFIVFSHLEPFAKVEPELVGELCANTAANPDVEYGTKALLATYISKNGKQPAIEEMRQIQSSGYCISKEVEQEEKLEFDVA